MRLLAGAAMTEGRVGAKGTLGERATAFEEIETIEIRLAKAQANAERLRRGGASENYLEAYFLVEALELQLQQALVARSRSR